MRPADRSKLIIAGAVAFIALAVALGWLWGAKKTQDLESSARGSIVATTARLQESLALSPDAPDALASLEQHAKAVGQALEALRREDAKRNRPLAEAAELYLVDAQAMLRNQTNATRARAAALASRRALAAHMSHAAGRGQGWIEQALALKARAERDHFDYRTSIGTWAELLRAHRDTQDKVRAALPAARLLEQGLVDAAYKRAKDAEQQAAAELERIRQMAIPR
jgi:hypothetical protein